MKRQIALGLALAMAMASAPVEAQFGGLKKKAREALEGKKADAGPDSCRDAGGRDACHSPVGANPGGSRVRG